MQEKREEERQWKRWNLYVNKEKLLHYPHSIYQNKSQFRAIPFFFNLGVQFFHQKATLVIDPFEP